MKYVLLALKNTKRIPVYSDYKEMIVKIDESIINNITFAQTEKILPFYQSRTS